MKKIRRTRRLSLLLALCMILSAMCLAACGGDPETEDTEDTKDTDTASDTSLETIHTEEKGMELIPDLSFMNGIALLSQKDHSDNERFTVLGTHSFYEGREATDPRWRLAQWDSGPCLVENRINDGANAITDGKWRRFSYDPSENVMTFKLDTSLYYQGEPAKQGDYWPHLLIEQGDFGYESLAEEEKAYYSCDAEKLFFSMDIKLEEYELTRTTGDWVNAAQFLIYFYVKGKETNDFCWFGVSLFDNRTQFGSTYVAYDGGKPDASGAMIYLIGSRNIYNSDNTFWEGNEPTASDKWLHIEIDLKPYLEKMLKAGRRDGYFKADSLDGLCINGMNLGWETISTFNHSMSVRNLSLRSYLPEE